MSRFVEALERNLRRFVVYPLLRMVFRNPVSNAPIDVKKVNRILIFRYDRIGDMILTTPVLRILKRRNPLLRLDVLASKANAEIVQQNPCVDNLFVLETNWFKLFRQILRLRRQSYDVVLNFIFNRTTGPGMMANLIAPDGHKVGQGPDRYAFYFNRLVKLRRFEQHMFESYVEMVEQVFGINISRDEPVFELAVDVDSRRTVDEWLEKMSLRRKSQGELPGLQYLILNPAGKDEERSLSEHQVAGLVESLSGKPAFRPILLESPDNAALIQAVRRNQAVEDCPVYRTKSKRPLIELASLIEGAILVITPDTSIVHFASAMQTPVLVIFGQQRASREWLPWRVPYDHVTGTGQQKISGIETKILIEKAESFIANVLDTQRVPSSGIQ